MSNLEFSYSNRQISYDIFKSPIPILKECEES